MIIRSLQSTADEMVQYTIQDCLDGDRVEIAGKDTTYELLHYQTGITNPAARIMTNEARPLNIVVALARFVWMMSGNNRLEDIKYYEPKVGGFSDNGLVVPGSCYGARLFDYQSDVDQIFDGVIPRLIGDPNSRQATAVVWAPHDAVRASRDIPCTHGMFFHIRDDRLHMCVTMRSNNAFRILPFNIFEFTLLQEVVAASIQCELGDYVHWAASMHIYDNEFEMPKTRDLAYNAGADSKIMPPMPFEDVQEQITLLCQLEAAMRHAGTQKDTDSVLQQATDYLNPYWLRLFEPLALWGTFVKRDISQSRKWINNIVPQQDSLFDLAVPILARGTAK